MHIDKWTNGTVVGQKQGGNDGKGCLNHLCCIVDAIQGGAARLVEVVVGGGGQHRELFCKSRVSLGSSGQLVEYVVVPLLCRLVGDPRLLQQVVLAKCFSHQWPIS